MEECKKAEPCHRCMCYGSYNTGGVLYCKCGYYKPKREEIMKNKPIVKRLGEVDLIRTSNSDLAAILCELTFDYLKTENKDTWYDIEYTLAVELRRRGPPVPRQL